MIIVASKCWLSYMCLEVHTLDEFKNVTFFCGVDLKQEDYACHVFMKEN